MTGNELLHDIFGVKKVGKSKEDVIVGIEIEAENVNTDLLDGEDFNKLNRFWTMVADGSLDNHGQEFVSKPLHYNKQLDIALEDVTDILQKVQAQTSYRCGLHVHLNVSHLNLNELYTLLLVYAFFEDAIFLYCGQERASSCFCIPITNTYLMRRLGSSAKLVEAIREWPKYMGLNLQPLKGGNHNPPQGTVEFRQHKGTLSSVEIKAWVSIIAKIYKNAIFNDTVLDMISNASNDPVSFLRSFFNNAFPADVTDEQLKEAYQSGMLSMLTLK